MDSPQASSRASSDAGQAPAPDVPILCPACSTEVVNGRSCGSCGKELLVKDGVLSLVDSGYARSFSAQWATYARTQLDSASGTSISEKRFADVTGWTPAEISGRTVLDAGCGAGRFSEVAIKWGARTTAVDLSEAVYSARANVAHAARARFIQADCLQMPFPKRKFDFAFSIGVAQHTPDPLCFVREVAEAVRPGGRAAFWIYDRRFIRWLHPKYLLRPLTRRLTVEQNMKLARGLVRVFFPVAERVAPLPWPLSKAMLRALPIQVYLGTLPLPPGAQREWAELDTLDMYSPRYDLPQEWSDVERVLRECGARRIERGRPRGLTIRAWF